MKIMHKTDVILNISETTGIGYLDCERICKTFEDLCGSMLVRRVFGSEASFTQSAATVAFATGYDVESCEAVLSALEGCVDATLEKKLHPFRRNA